jgi:hypothetical protein
MLLCTFQLRVFNGNFNPLKVERIPVTSSMKQTNFVEVQSQLGTHPFITAIQADVFSCSI